MEKMNRGKFSQRIKHMKKSLKQVVREKMDPFWAKMYDPVYPGIEWHLRFFPQFKALYGANPKCGYSTVTRTFIRLTCGESGNVGNIKNDLFSRRNNTIKLYPKAQIRYLLTSPDIFRFTFVRNPYSRLLSAYKNRIRIKHAQHSDDYAKIFAMKNMDITDPMSPQAPEIKFEDFATYVCKHQDVREMDNHWRPQHLVIRFGVINYSFVGFLESFKDDFSHVLSQIKAPHDKWRSMVGTKYNASPKTNINDFYTEELRKMVNETYQDDFSLFGYSEQLPGR